MQHRYFTRAIGIAAVAGIVSIAGMTAANADSPFVCDSGEWCLWENKNYNDGDYNTKGEKQWNHNDSDRDYRDNRWRDNWNSGHDLTDSIDNEASSAWNRGSCKIWVYQHLGYEGEKTDYYVGQGADRDLSNNAVGDNRASSHRWAC